MRVTRHFRCACWASLAMGLLLAIAPPSWAGQPPFPNELKYPNIIKPDFQFGTYGSKPGQFIDPMGVAFGPNGLLYLVDSGNSRIQVLRPDGTPLNAWGSNGTAPGQLVAPSDIAIDEEGELYVADTGNSRIQVFSLDGAFRRQWGQHGTAKGQLNNPRSVAVSRDRVFVADTDNQRIQVFDRKGGFLFAFGKLGTENGEFSDPVAVTVDEEGFSYVCDHQNNRIEKFDQNGKFVDTWGKYGSHSGLMATPSDVSYQGGRVFVADLINHRVQVFDTKGNFLFQFGRHPNTPHEGHGRLHYPYALAANPTGQNVVVCEPFENRCQVFSKGDIQMVKNVDDSAWWDKATRFHYGTTAATSSTLLAVAEPDTHAVLLFDISQDRPALIRRFGGHGDEPGKFKSPEGVAIDVANHRLLAADMGHNRIQIFSLEPGMEGDYLASFGTGGNGPGQFYKPGTIELDGDGNIYILDVGNSRVQVFDGNLSFLRSWGSFGRGPGQFNMPSDLSFNQAGDTLYVLDSYNYRVEAFDKQGNFLFTWGGPGSSNEEFIWPYGLEAGKDGFVYVSDAGAQRVQKFDEQGHFVDSFGSFGSDVGQFYKPKGIAMSSRGILYVLDFGNHRGQMINPSVAAAPMLAHQADVTATTVDGRFIGEWGIGELQQMGQPADARPRIQVAGLRIGAGLAAFAAFGLIGLRWRRKSHES
jgi:DNA-binding beta-propeller fold protein YncE